MEGSSIRNDGIYEVEMGVLTSFGSDCDVGDRGVGDGDCFGGGDWLLQHWIC